MSGHLWLPQRASVPAPSEVAAYLLQQGWTLHTSNAQWATYQKTLAGRVVTLEVPQQAAAIDYPRAFGILLDDLTHIEDRSASALVRDLKASAVDIVRLAIDSAVTRDGRVPVEAGRRIYEASRDLLLAAACSVIDPRPVFSKRKPDEAMKLLDRARFGQTEVGSFILTMECSIAPRLQQPLLPDDGDPDAPLERKTSTRLAQALREAEAAARESSASGKIDPFAARTKVGVSANLCDAVAEMIEATAADTVAASFSFAVRRPLAVEVPRQVVFSCDTAPILREAAARLRDEATYPETDVVGPVVKLDSLDPTKGGEAVVKASVDGRFRSVRVALDAGTYVEAIEAHKERLFVRCVGELAREGRSLVLRNARDFGHLTDPEDQ
jgi:hypothetical protein